MKLNTKTGLTLLVFSLIALSPGQALAHYWGNGYRHSPVTAAYSALFDHGLASKFDQRFASIRSTGNLTFSTA
ncbi:zinc resistance sensor/chaperone ZraP, partial [Escherichia coli]|nr:zinc resistance sensor/chaperone ZraP [Escherichia coli]MDI0912856.1 zinc resistance sensor/chaperone ZraP [Escherichia coli]MDI0941326.1 zinc resistance sensor/chaperone ZraP [Escherichia coli]MDI1221590.1 zinc resistance sensor/chaperone ZraP [Escherichia coli]